MSERSASEPSVAAFTRGAVDLSALRAKPQGAGPPRGGTAAGGTGGQPASPNGAGAAGGGATMIDVTEATFQSEVLERSLATPVVVEFWAEWCGPCKQLAPVLEKLAAEGGGSWVLAKVDTDANQRIAAAFQVQSVPTVYAVIGGQPVDAFMGVIPESQLRQWIDALMQAASQAGLSGAGGENAAESQQGQAEGAAADGEQPADPAEEALADGDLERAEELYQQALAVNPGDASAAAGVAQVRLLRRAEGQDPEQVIAMADGRADDLEAQARAADMEVLAGRAEAGYARLVGVVRRSSGQERDKARDHLISLFAIAEPDDPAVTVARRNLANALF